MKPCLECGELTDASRCPECRSKPTKPSAASRGYDSRWRALSVRARRLQPWCTDCGQTEDLQADHTPEAWARKASGLPIRLSDIVIRCGQCNRSAGAARGAHVHRDD